jgi:succinoglycan biosynthesis protein ExoL
MKDENGRTQTVAFFSPDLTDVSTIKRADAFQGNGFDITVFSFVRARYNRDFSPRWRVVDLGRTSDGNYLHRFQMLLRSLAVLNRHDAYLKRADWFYARNIDQLLLALAAKIFFRARAKLIYEVLDVQPAFAHPGLRGRLFRLIERLCLSRTALLVVSSPGFIRNYFEPVQGFRGNWFLLENKLQASDLPAIAASRKMIAEPRQRPRGYKWVVSYVGLIRGQPTLDLIARLAARLRHVVLFEFHGILTTVDQKTFDETLSKNPNMIYCGDYVNPRDLPKIYGGADFVWALDLENADTNSRWLLPCRFYEAGLLAKPCLAGRHFEIGRKIENLDVGWTFDAPFEDELVTFFSTLTPDEYAEKCDRLASLPASTFAGDEDVIALCRFMAQGGALERPPPGERAHRIEPHHLAAEAPGGAVAASRLT